MRRLIVMRHAKSSWKSAAPGDHERPLNKRGRRDAPRIAARLVELRWQPERILSSDSTRTRQTLEGMLTCFGEDVQISYHRSLYHAGIEELRAEVLSVPDSVTTLMVLGHNPGWDEAARWLTGEDINLKTADALLLQRAAPSWRRALDVAATWTLVEWIRARATRSSLERW